ncbi:MAG: HD domain-containing protein [Lachnospiraceae bacterium]|nr:HD domain-containing protein [Lachnospiraceae bacterium]
MDKLQELTQKMITYYSGAPKQIQHFIKVHRFAQMIGMEEGLDQHTQFVLEAAALVHDIGIKPADEKYGSHGGKLQEQEGPAPAREMLAGLGFEAADTERICYLIAHHHTYTNVDGMDYRILLEADFLVNLYEDGVSVPAVEAALKNIFRTESGAQLCRTMFLG